MSNVDYRDFYVKFSSNSNKKNIVKEEAKAKASDCPVKRKKRKSAAFSVVMILLCFALTFLLAGILNKDGIAAVFGKGETHFAYAVVTEVKEGGDKKLSEYSQFVRAGGGGGNIILKEKKYYVVHAVYFTKEDAQTIQKRDKTTEILGLSEKIFSTDYDTLKPHVERYNEEKHLAILGLYGVIGGNAKTGDDDASIKEILKLLEPLFALKEKVLNDKNVDSSKTLSFIVAMDTLIGRFEGLTASSASRISLISDMRFQLFTICSDF